MSAQAQQMQATDFSRFIHMIQSYSQLNRMLHT